MSSAAGLQERVAWQPPAVKPLNEAVWCAWILKGRAQDRRNRESRAKAVRWISAAALFAAAVLWPHPAQYDVAVRFTVTAGALILMFQSLHGQRYTPAVIFGALVLLYNPVFPVFAFSGEWQRVLVTASAVPFLLSARPTERPVHNG